MDVFERSPTTIAKIHDYLVKELNLAKNEGEKSAEFIDRICQITLEVLWTQNERGEKDFERTDSMFEGLRSRKDRFLRGENLPTTLSLSVTGIP